MTSPVIKISSNLSKLSSQKLAYCAKGAFRPGLHICPVTAAIILMIIRWHYRSCPVPHTPILSFSESWGHKKEVISLSSSSFLKKFCLGQLEQVSAQPSCPPATPSPTAQLWKTHLATFLGFPEMVPFVTAQVSALKEQFLVCESWPQLDLMRRPRPGRSLS